MNSNSVLLLMTESEAIKIRPWWCLNRQ